MAASSTPLRPTTSIQEPAVVGMPRSYISQREVAAEYEPPVRGAALGNSFGSQYAANIVLDAAIQPKDGKRIVTIIHCSPPDWHVLLGSLDRSGGNGEHIYSQQVVPTPTQATIDADYLSTYDPIDETKSLKRTKKPRRKKTDSTYEDGYPKKQRKSKGVDNLIPQKFRQQITTVETTTTEVLPPENVNDIPEPADPDGDETLIVHEKLNDDQYARTITEEVIDESVTPLYGEEYGDIVTKTTEEVVVPDGTAADTGIDVTESDVAPLGNGKSIKRTKRVKGGSWPDPVEEKKAKQQPNTVPQKFLSRVTRTETTKKVAEIPASVLLDGDGVVGREYTRETPDRVEERTTTEKIDTAEDPLQSKFVETAFGGTTATTEEDLLEASEEAVGGFTVLEASVQDLGDGKFLKRVTTADAEFEELAGQNYLSELGITVPFTKQVVASDSVFPPGSDVDPIDAWRVSRKTVDEDALQTELESIHLIYPTQENVSLPDVLKSIGVKATRVLSNGNSTSKGSSGSTDNSSTVSVSADVHYEIEEGYSGPAPAEIHVFFLPQNASGPDDILAKIGALPWPLYRPKSSRITIGGMGLTKRFGLSRSSSGWSASESGDVQAFSNVAVIPATIHGNVPVEITYDDHIAPTGFLDAFLDANIAALDAMVASIRAQVAAGQGIFFGTSSATAAGRAAILAHLDALEAQLNFFADLSIDDAGVSVSPSTLEATTIPSIVAGKYVKNSTVSLYGYGMVKVTAVVIDITSIV